MAITSKLKRVILFLVALCLCFLAISQTHKKVKTTIISKCKGYWEYLPVKYNETNNRYPLIFYIHGGASYGSGTDASLDLLLSYEGIPYYINQNAFPDSLTVNGLTSSFIVISPQFTSIATPKELWQVLDYMLTRYRIDTNRIYCTGYSVGGDLAWKIPYSKATALRLAAISPVAGYNNPYSDTTARFIAEADLPAWAIHSSSDASIVVEASVNMVNKINSYNPPTLAILSKLTNVTHNNTVLEAYNPTFRPNGANMYEWFLKYSRNFPPIANAGTNKTLVLPEDSIVLDGSASRDHEAGVISYAWSKVSGPNKFILTGAETATPKLNGLVAGTYVFKLIVRDALLLSDSATTTITVINPNPNILPIANAGPDSTIYLPATSIKLSGAQSSDVGGSIDLYTWTKIEGPNQPQITAISVDSVMISNLKTGAYKFKLTVTDNEQAVSEDTVAVTVVNPFPNFIPSANAGLDQLITLPVDSSSLQGSGTDTDGLITAYKWRQISGPVLSQIVDSNLAITKIRKLSVMGIYKFELEVTDDSLATAKDTLIITVNPASKIIQVNVYGGSSAAGTGWNNWNVQSSLSSGTLSYTNGIPSTVTAVLSAHINIGDNGTNYPTTMCPASVGRYTSYSTDASRTLIFSGLDNSKKYDFEAYASRPGDNPTKFTIGTTSVTITINYNYTNKALFTNLIPSNGKITVTIDRTKTYSYLNGFTLTETGLGSTVPNQAPVARAGNDTTMSLPTNSVLLDGSTSTDSDGNIASYMWTKVSGSSTATLSNTTTSKPTLGNLQQGVYLIELKVSDNQGLTHSDTVKVTVLPEVINIAPVARAGNDTTISLPTNSVLLDGTASTDGDGNIASYMWTKVSGSSTATLSNSTTTKPTLGNLQQGVYLIELKVSDNQGSMNSDTVKVTVLPGINTPPIARAGADRTIVLPTNSVQLDGSSSSDIEESTVSYLWTLISGSGSITNFTNARPTVNNLQQGDCLIELKVSDSQGLTNSDTVKVTVLPAPNTVPIAKAGIDQTIVLPKDSVTLSGVGSSDAVGNIIGYKWSQVSGPLAANIQSSQAVTTVVKGLSQNGTYVFELVVTDDSSTVGKDTVAVIVNPTPPALRFVKVNVYGGSNPAAAEWNNWNVNSTLKPAAFKYSDASTSTITAELSNSLNVGDNGTNYPTTMCPASVGRYASYASVASRTLVFSGLDNTKKYDFEAYVSRPGDNPTKFTIGTTSTTIITNYNYTNKVLFTNLIPSNGKITVTIDRTKTYSYINGFILTEIANTAEQGLRTSSAANLESVQAAELLANEKPKIRLYPNPTKGRVVVSFSNEVSGIIKMALLDGIGSLRRQWQFVKGKGFFQKEVTLEGIPQGIYFLELSSVDGKKMGSATLVIQ